MFRFAAVACALAVLLGGCASSSSRKASAASESKTEDSDESGGCKPLFPSDLSDWRSDLTGSWRAGEPRHSCWHRLWEVPAMAVVAPVAVGVFIGVVTSPIWMPLILLR